MEIEHGKQKNKRRIRKWFQGFFEQWELQTMVWPGIIFMMIFNFIPICCGLFWSVRAGN